MFTQTQLTNMWNVIRLTQIFQGETLQRCLVNVPGQGTGEWKLFGVKMCFRKKKQTCETSLKVIGFANIKNKRKIPSKFYKLK